MQEFQLDYRTWIVQEDQLNQYGCEKIFNSSISGSKSKRPGLDKAIEFARSGDTVVGTWIG